MDFQEYPEWEGAVIALLDVASYPVFVNLALEWDVGVAQE